LNDINQLEVGIKAVHKAGGVVEGTVCYSGDSRYSLSCFFPIQIVSGAVRYDSPPKIHRLLLNQTQAS
jgi:pyruvate/oxaloacetate carboxyltransferase